MRGIVVACTMAGLAACAPVGPDYRRPDLDVPKAYAESEPAGTTLPAVPADWWRLYQDATLDRLMNAGLTQGSDVRLAIARIEEAAALRREANATLLPEIDASGVVSRSGSSTQTPSVRAGAVSALGNFALSANTALELDFWGRLRRLREAAQAQYMATDYARGVVELTLTAAIARTYFNVRSLDAQIAVSGKPDGRRGFGRNHTPPLRRRHRVGARRVPGAGQPRAARGTAQGAAARARGLDAPARCAFR
jgi:Outer membrane protein